MLNVLGSAVEIEAPSFELLETLPSVLQTRMEDCLAGPRWANRELYLGLLAKIMHWMSDHTENAEVTLCTPVGSTGEPLTDNRDVHIHTRDVYTLSLGPDKTTRIGTILLPGLTERDIWPSKQGKPIGVMDIKHFVKKGPNGRYVLKSRYTDRDPAVTIEQPVNGQLVKFYRIPHSAPPTDKDYNRLALGSL